VRISGHDLTDHRTVLIHVIAASLLLTLYNKHNTNDTERQEIHDTIDTVCIILDGLASFSKLAQRGAALLDALRPRDAATSIGEDWRVKVMRADSQEALRPPIGLYERAIDQTLMASSPHPRDEGWAFATDDGPLDNAQYDLSGLLFSDNDLQNVFETDLDWAIGTF